MALFVEHELVNDDTTENHFLATTKVKQSGVHIGDGVFLAANHYPTPDGSSAAKISYGTDGEINLGRTTEYDFVLPDNPADWADSGYGYESNGKFMSLMAWDSAMHVLDEPTDLDLAAAPMLIYNDPDELTGNVTAVGFPGRSPLGNNDMHYAEGFMKPNSAVFGGVDDAVLSTFSSGVRGLGGMSGGPLYLEYTLPSTGEADHYLIGQFSRSTSTTAVSNYYNKIADQLVELGKDADDFPTQVLVSGQTAGSEHTLVEGTFFNEKIFGGVNDDRLIGAGGDDALMGDAGADTFVFADGHGNDTILDFDADEDMLDLSGVTAGSIYTTQDGSDVRISYGDSDATITIENAQKSEIDAFIPAERLNGINPAPSTEDPVDEEHVEEDPVDNSDPQDDVTAPIEEQEFDGVTFDFAIDDPRDLGLRVIREKSAFLWVEATDDNDKFIGSDGQDRVSLKGGNDHFEGRSGNDSAFIQNEKIYYDGGDGFDRVHINPNGANGNRIEIFAEGDARRTDDMSTFENVEYLFSSSQDDVITIGSGTDFERVRAKGGDDVLNIHGGNNILVEGDGGADTFNILPDENVDSARVRIKDFSIGEDALYLDGTLVDLQSNQQNPKFTYTAENSSTLVIGFGDDHEVTLHDVDAFDFV